MVESAAFSERVARADAFDLFLGDARFFALVGLRFNDFTPLSKAESLLLRPDTPVGSETEATFEFKAIFPPCGPWSSSV
jgi:hypothetical protein